MMRKLWLRLLATLGVGAALMLSWWWKIDAAREPTAIPEASLGQTIQLGRVQITPLALELVEDENIVMTAEVLNVTGTTQVGVFSTSPNPPQLVLGGEVLPAPEVLLLRDNALLFQLQPRLPEKVSLTWSAPPGWTPEQIELRFEKQAFKLVDNLFGQASWLGYSPAARIYAVPQVAP